MSLRRARLVIGAQLLLGLAVLTLAGIGYAGAEDGVAVLSIALLAALGLCEVGPALLAAWLLRRGRGRTGLLVSGAAAFVPGAMIVFLALTSFRVFVVLVVGSVGALLMGAGFHQLWVRSRLP